MKFHTVMDTLPSLAIHPPLSNKMFAEMNTEDGNLNHRRRRDHAIFEVGFVNRNENELHILSFIFLHDNK